MKMNKKIEKDFTNLIKKFNIEPDLVDLKSLWDSELSYQENKTILENFLKQVGTDLKRQVDVKAEELEIEEMQREQREKEEQKAKLELKKAIEDIQNRSNSDIDKYFNSLNEYIDTLVNSETVYGLIVEGDVGLGKSFTTIKRLQDKGLAHETDWVMLNTHITPMEFYEFLWKHQDKIIVLDDISNLFYDEIKVNIMMASLWSAMKKRIVTWISSTTKISALVPRTFSFNGIAIICPSLISKVISSARLTNSNLPFLSV